MAADGDDLSLMTRHGIAFHEAIARRPLSPSRLLVRTGEGMAFHQIRQAGSVSRLRGTDGDTKPGAARP
jgi:hypothetical protein